MPDLQSLRFFDVFFRARGDEHSRHEVPLSDVSEKEVILLSKLHGSEAVVVRKQVKDSPRETDLEEHYIALAQKYTSANVDGVKLVEAVFNTMLSNLTARMDNPVIDAADAAVAAMQRAAVREGEDAVVVQQVKQGRETVNKVTVARGARTPSAKKAA